MGGGARRRLIEASLPPPPPVPRGHHILHGKVWVSPGAPRRAGRCLKRVLCPSGDHDYLAFCSPVVLPARQSTSTVASTESATAVKLEEPSAADLTRARCARLINEFGADPEALALELDAVVDIATDSDMN